MKNGKILSVIFGVLILLVAVLCFDRGALEDAHKRDALRNAELQKLSDQYLDAYRGLDLQLRYTRNALDDATRAVNDYEKRVDGFVQATGIFVDSFKREGSTDLELARHIQYLGHELRKRFLELQKGGG